MAEKKHTTEELLEILKDYHIESDEESVLGSNNNIDCSSENESLSSDDNTAASEEEEEDTETIHSEYSRKCSLPDVNVSEKQWTRNFEEREKVTFTGKSGLQKQFPSNITPIALFEHLFDHDIIMLMVLETNKYAQQYINEHHLSQHARMKTWKEVTEEEMRKFIGIILLTGLIKLPKIEDYWKKDPLFFHPLFHHIQMSYNRFSLILKNWHFCDNKEATPGNKLHKVSKIMDMLLSNIQKLYIPGEEISIDESVISHNTQLTFHQYNPVKCYRYGIKMYKLCDTSGYVWNMSIYSDTGSNKNKRSSLNYSGSIVIDLGEPLLNCGRLFVTDNRYSSIELATYLKAHNTEYCGVLKRDKRNFPQSLKSMKLKKGEMKSMSNSEGIRIFKYQDKEEIFMISTFHGNKMRTVAKSKQSRVTATRPSVIVDCNRVKSGIRLLNQMIKYYSLARKSIKWYRKIIFQVLSIGVLNTWIIYNKVSKSCTLVDFTKEISSSLLGNFNTLNQHYLSQRLGSIHELTNIPRKESGKIARKRCVSCYASIANLQNIDIARKKAKKVSTECLQCNKAYCLSCFNAKHKLRS